MRIYTIGFTKTTAQHFFERLREAGVRSVSDVRLSNQSQLAGFAKRDDLRYFLDAILDIRYRELPILAPTPALLNNYRSSVLSWDQYASEYLTLLSERHPEREIQPTELMDTCLLCSEATPEHCHRRLAAEFLARAWQDVSIRHL